MRKLFLLLVLLSTAHPATSQSGRFLRFPVDGYTAYTAPVTSIMDRDLRWNYIEGFMGQKGNYASGCKAYISATDIQDCNASNASKPWGYKKLDGTTFTGPFNYKDGVSSANRYMWYDNHTGYDYGIPGGKVVKAAAAGRVVILGGDYNQVVVEHPNGYRTFYLHMTDVSLGINQQVQKGQAIGLVGSTGVGKNVHLHFTLKKLVNGVWQNIDPYDAAPTQIGPAFSLWE